MRRAETICPGVTPRIVASTSRAFVMTYLDPDHHRLWKGKLLEDRVDPTVAAAVAHRLVAIHAATAGDESVRSEFDNVDVFAARRLDPYFAASASRHPELAGELDGLRRSYLANRNALVHGDVSPKNILVGPDGPVLLDAECATWGDPAFDVAFCTTHLLLKIIVVPHAATLLSTSVEDFGSTYERSLVWEDPIAFWRRCVETTAGLLTDPPATLPEMAWRWFELVGLGRFER